MTASTVEPLADIAAPAPDEIEIRGLSVGQPHAGLIAGKFKNREGRSKPISYRGIVAIHASSRSFDEDALGLPHIEQSYRVIERFFPELTMPGAILATARIVGCHKSDPGGSSCTSVWCRPEAAWHWELAEISNLANPIPYKGSLCLWRPTPEVRARLIAHLSMKGTPREAVR